MEDQATHGVELDPNPGRHLRVYVIRYACPISSFDCIQLHRGIAGGVWTAIRIIVLRLFSMKPQFETPAMVWFLAACIADLLIAVTLVTYLVRYGVF